MKSNQAKTQSVSLRITKTYGHKNREKNEGNEYKLRKGKQK